MIKSNTMLKERLTTQSLGKIELRKSIDYLVEHYYKTIIAAIDPEFEVTVEIEN